MHYRIDRQINSSIITTPTEKSEIQGGARRIGAKSRHECVTIDFAPLEFIGVTKTGREKECPGKRLSCNINEPVSIHFDRVRFVPKVSTEEAAITELGIDRQRNGGVISVYRDLDRVFVLEQIAPVHRLFHAIYELVNLRRRLPNFFAA